MDNISEEAKKTIQNLGSIGGYKRKSNLSAEERTEIARNAGLAKGKKGLPRATHEGSLKFGESEVDCYVLKDGTRVIASSAIRKALGLNKPGANTREKSRATNLPSFLASESLRPYLEGVFNERPPLIQFVTKNGAKAQGIEAKFLPDICDAYLKARVDGNLKESQLKTALAAEIIVRTLAKIGIIALVDEASGFQEERIRDGLQVLLKKFISEDLLKWTRRFPHLFFKNVYRIYGLKYTEGQTHGPGYLGKFINKYVYNCISPEVLIELKNKNPAKESGGRPATFHQYLTPDIGLPALDKHISKITALLQASRTKEEFDELFNRLQIAESEEICIKTIGKK